MSKFLSICYNRSGDTMIEQLKNFCQKISNLEYQLNTLEWDLEVNVAKKAREDLIEVLNNLEKQIYELKTSLEYEELLKQVINSHEFLEISVLEQDYIKILYKECLESKKIPKDFYLDYSKTLHRSTGLWEEAKTANDYTIFKNILDEVITKTKQYYKYLQTDEETLYDVALNQYEKGLSTKVIDPLFARLKEELIPLIKVNNHLQEKHLKYTYSTDELMETAKYILNYIGFDNDRGSLGIYPHGFTTKIGNNDVRIAFKKNESPLDFLMTIIHEGGHGIFEQNISRVLWDYGIVGINNLMALHESQSRFYENILGRNKNFWIPIYDIIQGKLHLEISLDEFVELLNYPKCSLIRTEADELTYPLHIIIRYEIERDLFEGLISIDQLPQVWKQKMKDYLDVDVVNDNEGLLQDVHWSQGNFGYFPTYLLGTIYDGMFLKAILRDLGSLDEILKEGKIKEITKYLTNHVYKFGGTKTSKEILDSLQVGELSAEPVLSYFNQKYNKEYSDI